MTHIKPVLEEIAQAIAAAAAARGHKVTGHACSEPGCGACALVKAAREAHPQAELPKVPERSREPGEEG